METINLTKKEKEWIKELKVLIRKKPKSLILFANGHLNILKGTKENPSCEMENGTWIEKNEYSYDDNKILNKIQEILAEKRIIIC